MILILISWCYIFLTLVNFGFVAKSIIKFYDLNKIFHLVLGLILILIIGHIWAFYSGFGILFHTILLLSNILIFVKHKNQIITFYKDLLDNLMVCDFKHKFLFTSIFFLILFKTASQGSLMDNETYYIQTISWLNNYGFVNGLANLHMFFGQTSGWHVLQSVFSFHFFAVDFNDIGGFLLIVLNSFAFKSIFRINISFPILLFLPVLNFFLLEFCVVPSPDFGVIFFSLLAFEHFTKAYENASTQDFYLSLFLVLSGILVKITAVGLVVFPLVLFFKINIKSYYLYLKTSLIILLFALLWFCKNLIISGYPLFPSSMFSQVFSPSYQIPESLYNILLRKDKLMEFFATPNEIANLNSWDLFIEWLTYSKISFIFNLSLLLSILFIPALFIKQKIKCSFWWIYISFLFQLIFLALTSPQYRFAIHYLIIFALIFLSLKQNILKQRLIIISLSQLIVLGFLFFSIQPSQFSSKAYTLKSNAFQIKNLLIPAPNSTISNDYELKSLGNLNYYSAKEPFYFWSTGDCDLPCVNSEQLQYFMYHTQYIPQMIDSTDLSKGFYSKKILLKNENKP